MFFSKTEQRRMKIESYPQSKKIFFHVHVSLRVSSFFASLSVVNEPELVCLTLFNLVVLYCETVSPMPTFYEKTRVHCKIIFFLFANIPSLVIVAQALIAENFQLFEKKK